MRLRIYARLWLLITLILSYEYLALNSFPNYSLLAFIRVNIHALDGFNLSPEAGKPLSLWMGSIGLGLMVIMLLYTVRKRLVPPQKLGRMPAWLDFHIFCGLVGPTLVVFHTNFKVGGLVAISFWSMIIAVLSGIIGRYFYLQVVAQKSELERQVQKLDVELVTCQKFATVPVSDVAVETLKANALAFVGGYEEKVESLPRLARVLCRSLVGDVRLMFSEPKTLAALPPESRYCLKRYALTQRKIVFLRHYQKIMGYWHSFHLPFAIFMYLIAAVHVVTALYFRVN